LLESIFMADSASRETLNPELVINFEDPKHGGKRQYDPSRVDEDGYVYTPYITVRGKRIYHPTGVFKFLANK